MNADSYIEILAKAARQRLDLLEDGETSLAYYGEVDEIRAALGWVERREANVRCSRENPCPSRNELHELLWGECFWYAAPVPLVSDPELLDEQSYG